VKGEKLGREGEQGESMIVSMRKRIVKGGRSYSNHIAMRRRTSEPWQGEG
jgi:hypothetical protein